MCARVGLELTLPSHTSTAHFSAPIMSTALKAMAFEKTSARTHDARERCEAQGGASQSQGGGKHKQAKKGKQWTKAQLDAQRVAKEQQEKQEEEPPEVVANISS